MNHFLQSLLIHFLILGLFLTWALLVPRHLETKNQIMVEGAPSLNQKILATAKNNKKVDLAIESDEKKSEMNLAESAGVAPSEMQKYLIQVSRQINQFKKYPEDARMNEQEGIVEVLLEIAPNGKVIHFALSQLSSFESLNQAVLMAIQKMGDLPPLPLDLAGNLQKNPIKLRVPIRFQLI